jgi:hypothetical protein
MDQAPWQGLGNDAVSRRLLALANTLEGELGPAVRVERDPSEGAVILHPTRPDAMLVGWDDFEGQAVHLWLGANGCWWEVGRSMEAVDSLEESNAQAVPVARPQPAVQRLIATGEARCWQGSLAERHGSYA